MKAWQADPYRFPGMRGLPEGEEASTLSPPSPLSGPLPGWGRPPGGLAPADRRRLDLHACLTTAGVPPRAGDLHAIEALSTVDDTTYAAIRRWITGTH
ncbi:hypothetical protein ABZ128_24675 [Streptomyces sp. NPDC006326]|uniref:hypothetical protein n=1 Tax=Streptomyces sp. NPDC006326 TaxID=3156752 RepID=UPI0033BDC12E